MIGMQRENPVHRLGQRRIDIVFPGRDRKAHVQEIAGVIQIILRIDEGLADGILIGHGRDRRQLGDQADRRDLALPGIRDVGRIVVEGRHCADHADHRRHGMAVAAEAAEEIVHLFMHHRMMRDTMFEIAELFDGRQFAIEKQVADFQIMRFLGQLLDRVAPIPQFALVAVDEGDRGIAACGRGEARIIGENARLAIQLADVQNVRPLGRGQDGQLVIGIVDQQFGGLCLGHPKVLSGLAGSSAREYSEDNPECESRDQPANSVWS